MFAKFLTRGHVMYICAARSTQLEGKQRVTTLPRSTAVPTTKEMN